MRVKLTDAAIRSYTARAAAYSIGDAACPGLCIRITAKGIRSFAFAYRNKTTGKVEWLTLGRYPDLPLTHAREFANDARKTVAAGGTPLGPKAQQAEAQKKLRLRRGGRSLLRRQARRRNRSLVYC
jgi:Arm DNA-binding domain